MNVDILEESFDLVAPRGDELVAVFYGNLFVRAPHVRSLFAHVEMKKHARRCSPRSSCCASRCGTPTRSSRGRASWARAMWRTARLRRCIRSSARC